MREPITRNMMADILEAAAKEADPTLRIHVYKYSSTSDPTSTTFVDIHKELRWKAGDPIPKLEDSNIMPSDIFRDLMFQRLEDRGIHENRFRQSVSDYTNDSEDGTVRSVMDGYVRSVWTACWSFPFLRSMADAATMEKLEKIFYDDSWREGVSVRKRHSSGFYLGQEVKPRDNKNAKGHRWWFITKYETSAGMRVYRLLRNDGRMSTTAALTPIEDVL